MNCLVNINLQEANLEGANLKGANLEGANLRGANLRGANLKGAKLKGANLEVANLEGANLTKANLYETNFEGANLTKVTLEGSNLHRTNLSRTNLNEAYFFKVHSDEVNFTGANLTGVIFSSKIAFRTANFSDANLTGMNIENCYFVSANFTRANLSSINFKTTNLVFSSFEDANLEGANLIKTHLAHVNLKGANLRGANLEGANLEGANLLGANLERANLEGANLRGANLKGAKLKGAIGTNLKGTNIKLERVDLSGASTNFNDTVIHKKISDSNFIVTDTNLIRSDRKIILFASDFDYICTLQIVTNIVQKQIIEIIRSFLQKKALVVNVFDNYYFELLKYNTLSPSQFKSLFSILRRLGIYVDDVILENIQAPSCFISHGELDFIIHYSFLDNDRLKDFLNTLNTVHSKKFNKERQIYTIPQNKNSLDFLFHAMNEWGFEFTPSALNKISHIIDDLWSPPDKKIIFDGDDLLLTHKRKMTIYFKIKNGILGANLINSLYHDVWEWRIKSSSLTTKGIILLQEVTDELDVYVTREVNDRLQTLSRQMRESLAASYAHDYEIQIDGLGCELKPFQRAGIVYAIRHKKTLIADEMGLGKTVEALATLNATNAFPALVICPASLKLNWLYEAKKWLINRTTTIFSENFINLDHDITIINYESLAKIMTGKGKYATPNFLFKGVILDEFHYTKNPKAARTIYSKLIAEKTEICLGLTGTPVLSRPIELLSQLQIIGRIHELGGESNFKHHFCWDEDKGGYNGARNLTELNEKLRATCYIRREKDDVTELPPKQDKIIYLELDNREEYDTAEENLVEWLLSNGMEEKAKKASDALQVVKYEYLKQLAIAGKFTSIIEWIESFLKSGKKLVVFATHKGVVKNINNKFRDVSLSINGDTPQEKRQGIVNQFQDDPEIKLIVINMKTGGMGFTLTSSADVVFCEMGWTPADHHQAEDRCHRIGQTEVVNSYYLLAADSIDTDIYQTVMIEKLEVVTNATNGDEELRVETISVLERITTLFEERMKNKKILQTTQHINKLEMKEV
jgi:uncharacterized protein YjbI with pentapeptide repeats